jgi:chemotaxis protein methyltransferase CheR
VVVNCAALPVNLIESELFGHEKGAFTGADRRRIGRFELADGGTLLLDEIGELPLEVQPKLLRVLQEGEVERVGGTQTTRFDVRVIAATNRNIRAEMADGRFREDLYYRVAVFSLTVPPLRERLDDIPVLVQHFVRLLTERRGIKIDQVPVEVMRRLQAYSWPGNVRELKNVLERAVLVSGGGVLRLAEPLRDSQPGNGHPEEERPSTRVGMTLAEVERQHIVETLEACGKISGPGGASEALGLPDSTLRYRMKKLGIPLGRQTRPETD